jgi:hypothetical protein
LYNVNKRRKSDRLANGEKLRRNWEGVTEHNLITEVGDNEDNELEIELPVSRVSCRPCTASIH